MGGEQEVKHLGKCGERRCGEQEVEVYRLEEVEGKIKGVDQYLPPKISTATGCYDQIIVLLMFGSICPRRLEIRGGGCIG